MSCILFIKSDCCIRLLIRVHMHIFGHCLTTVQNADIIAVFQNGKVVEKGTRNQLMAQHGACHACKCLSLCCTIVLCTTVCCKMQLSKVQPKSIKRSSILFSYSFLSRFALLVIKGLSIIWCNMVLLYYVSIPRGNQLWDAEIKKKQKESTHFKYCYCNLC